MYLLSQNLVDNYLNTFHGGVLSIEIMKILFMRTYYSLRSKRIKTDSFIHSIHDQQMVKWPALNIKNQDVWQYDFPGATVLYLTMKSKQEAEN